MMVSMLFSHANRILNASVQCMCIKSVCSTCLCLQFLQLLVRLPLCFGICMDGLFTALDGCLGILYIVKKSDEEARHVDDDEQTSGEKRRAYERTKTPKKAEKQCSRITHRRHERLFMLVSFLSLAICLCDSSLAAVMSSLC